uniref:Uncharacterized protein n=1 Tax=Parascaris equorum TaxID=6256 RepID=A0A914RQA8_PAREQ
ALLQQSSSSPSRPQSVSGGVRRSSNAPQNRLSAADPLQPTSPSSSESHNETPSARVCLFFFVLLDPHLKLPWRSIKMCCSILFCQLFALKQHSTSGFLRSLPVL